jgi:hypothetical protein
MADQNPWGTCRNFGLEFGVSKSTVWCTLTKCNKDAFTFKKPLFSCSETNLEQVIDLQLSYLDGWDKAKIKLNKVVYSDKFGYGLD